MLTALRDIDRPVVVGAVDQHTNEFDAEQLAYQQQFLAQVDRPKGYLALDYGPNHIVRRTSPPLADSPFQESFARQIAIAAGAPLKGPGASSASMRIAWLEGPNHDTEPFFRISAKELLHGTTDARRAEIAQRIQGNIVLTGIAMPNSDWHDTALSVWTDQKMLGVMVHAHILAQLLDGRYLYELDERARGILLISSSGSPDCCSAGCSANGARACSTWGSPRPSSLPSTRSAISASALCCRSP